MELRMPQLLFPPDRHVLSLLFQIVLASAKTSNGWERTW